MEINLKTIVYQSYRTYDVPTWINTCMKSVRTWAQGQGYEYEFIDDSFFELAPEWYRQKTGGNILLITDLARLVKAQEYLNAGYQQVIWVDIDVIIVNTKKFRIKLEEGFCFCLEHWVGLNNKKQIIISKNINNSLMVFKSHNTFLDYYVECCLNIVKRKTKLEKTSVGTDFLTKLYTLSPFKVLTNVGLFSPYFLYLYLSDVNLSNDLLKKYFPSDLYAVNLCNSFRNKVHCNISMEDQLYEAAIEKLLRRND